MFLSSLMGFPLRFNVYSLHFVHNFIIILSFLYYFCVFVLLSLLSLDIPLFSIVELRSEPRFDGSLKDTH